MDIKLQITVLILASASKSRKNMLKNSDIEFSQILSGFDESTIKQTNSSDLALELSLAKAKKVFEKVSYDLENEFQRKEFQILGCDSIFEFKG